MTAISILLLTGMGDSNEIATLYRNDAGAFVDSGLSLMGVAESAVGWADYDRDGNLDLLVTGDDNGTPSTTLYRNDGGGNLTAIGAGLPGIRNGSVAWGDYDNDSLLDLLITGATSGGQIAAIYHQKNGLFTDIDAGLTAVSVSAATWGDYDLDKDLDLILLGNDGGALLTQLYRNTDCISDLSIVKSASQETVQAGDTITYTIVFTNAGPQPAINVAITDEVPLDLTNVQVMSLPIGAGVVITESAVANGKGWQVSDLAIK